MKAKKKEYRVIIRKLHKTHVSEQRPGLEDIQSTIRVFRWVCRWVFPVCRPAWTVRTRCSGSASAGDLNRPSASSRMLPWSCQQRRSQCACSLDVCPPPATALHYPTCSLEWFSAAEGNYSGDRIFRVMSGEIFRVVEYFRWLLVAWA